VRDLEPNTALVAIVPSRRDWELVRTQGWYRIPVRTAPEMVKEGEVTHIAFYFPSEFGEEKYSIRWYAPVEDITIRKRKELLDDPRHRNADEDYFTLPQGLPSRRPCGSRKPQYLEDLLP